MNNKRPRLLPGHGPEDDYEFKQARKGYECAHIGPHSRGLQVDCQGPVFKGEMYVRTRQSWLEWEPVNLACLVAANYFGTQHGDK